VNTLSVGDFAYLDSFAGRVPCKVLEIKALVPGIVTSSTAWQATAQVTASRPGYSRGEVVTVTGLDIYPRSSSILRSGCYRIRPFTAVIPEGEQAHE
jgi:hypothetical protein